MIDKIHHILSDVSFFHVNMLIILGLALFGGTIGGRLFQKMKIPQVVGYIVIGVFLGPSVANVIDREMVRVLQPLTYFALGLIGFMVGGELKKSVLARYGKQFLAILFCEGMFSFVLVTAAVGLLGTYFFRDSALGWGMGLLFGAISSATAPAATTDVLWEYRTRGPLTTTVFGIVALDDALSLLLFAVAASLATRIIGVDHASLWVAILHPLYEIGGAIVIGYVSGKVLVRLLHKYTEQDRVLAFLIGIVLFVLGLALAIDVSMLLASMVLGAVVVNGAPRISKDVFKLLGGFTPPIFILFFVFIGAKLNFAQIDPLVIGLVAVYLMSRTFGKMSGAYFGAVMSGAPRTVRAYLPFCLFSQAGVAIGLSIVASQILPERLGNVVIAVITLSTFIVQLIGPACVKFAVTKAGEVGLNITEEDIIKNVRVTDILEQDVPSIRENTTLNEILEYFSDYPFFYYPVVGSDRRLKGIVSIDTVRQIFRDKEGGDVIIADDILEPAKVKINADASGTEAKEIFDRYRVDYIPVIDRDDVVIGMLEERMFDAFIARRQIELEQKERAL